MEQNSAVTRDGQPASALQASIPSKLLYSKKEAAQLLCLSVRTIDNLITCKELKPVRIGKSARFTLAELQQFIRRDHDTHVN